MAKKHARKNGVENRLGSYGTRYQLTAQLCRSKNSGCESPHVKLPLDRKIRDLKKRRLWKWNFRIIGHCFSPNVWENRLRKSKDT